MSNTHRRRRFWFWKFTAVVVCINYVIVPGGGVYLRRVLFCWICFSGLLAVFFSMSWCIAVNSVYFSVLIKKCLDLSPVLSGWMIVEVRLLLMLLLRCVRVTCNSRCSRHRIKTAPEPPTATNCERLCIRSVLGECVIMYAWIVTYLLFASLLQYFPPFFENGISIAVLGEYTHPHAHASSCRVVAFAVFTVIQTDNLTQIIRQICELNAGSGCGIILRAKFHV